MVLKASGVEHPLLFFWRVVMDEAKQMARVRRTRMVVTDFVHGGYVSEGTQWMKVRLLCKTCRRETGWHDGANPVVYCDHHSVDTNEMVSEHR